MSSSALLRSCLLALAALILSAPTARAGAVFEIREDAAANATDHLFVFGSPAATQTLTFPAGTIQRSGGTGAGLVFKSSAFPLSITTLYKCAAVAPHIHPNSAETVFVLSGKIRIHQFRGEEAGTNAIVTDVGPGEAGYIQQGAYHAVENISSGTTKCLVILDHPQGGVVFAAPALASLPRHIVNSAFSSPIFTKGVTGNGAIIAVQNCTGRW